ncbi:MAG: hypothetical protein JXA95_14190 [Spirochaetales bacterium]|nr:hypothetical protein [Spirochaetales bacterium]
MAEIILIGSSIFEQWYNFRLAFSGRDVRNLAVGGTTTSDWQKAVLIPLLAREKPKAVVCYVGSNDMFSLEEEVTKANLVTIRETIRLYDGEIKFAYFSIIKAPGKRAIWDKVERVNRFFRGSLDREDYFYDTDRVFFRDGELISEFFLEDQTHHPRIAYDALAEDAAPLMKTWLDSFC